MVFDREEFSVILPPILLKFFWEYVGLFSYDITYSIEN